MNCPQDNAPLELISGDFGTGVFHPDGTQEVVYEEGFQCSKCGWVYGESDLEPERD